MKFIATLVALNSILFISSSYISGSELVSSAAQLSLFRLTVSGYYLQSRELITVNTILAPDFVTITNQSIGQSSSGSEIRGFNDLQYFNIKGNISVTPRIFIHLRMGIGDTKINLPAADAQYLYIGTPTSWQGNIWAGGVKYILFPDTIITPAVAIDSTITYKTFPLSKVEINKTNGETQNPEFTGRYTDTEWQVAFTVSKKVLGFDPWVGLRFVYATGTLKNNFNAQIDVTRAGISPYLGVHIISYPRVTIDFTVSFLTETMYGTGLTLSF